MQLFISPKKYWKDKIFWIFIYMQHKEMSDFKEQVEIDKQRSELEKEYSDLAAQYDQFEGQKMMFNNDSLIEKLDAEKVKVQRLLEELRTVKTLESIGVTTIPTASSFAANVTFSVNSSRSCFN